MKPALALLAAWTTLSIASPTTVQAQFGPMQPTFTSPEVSAERTITFRIHAPNAKAVRLSAGDIPGQDFAGSEMTQGDSGVWTTTIGPVSPGAYRYTFSVDGLAVVDPRNPATSESNSNSSSLVVVPGSEFADLKDVPHGSVAEVAYSSQSLKRFRRMHVYTPPGYERGEGKFPVLYLLHGAMDSDDSWSTVGQAGVILDNLIASGKAKPMIVVMPAGHTGPFRFGPPGDRSFDKQMAEFTDDFTSSVRPHVEANFRVLPGREHRAIAGLSMGGAQSLDIGFGKLADYGYIGVFSSGVFGITGGFGGAAPSTDWEDKHLARLDDAELKKGLKLVWFACGKDDFLLSTNNATIAMLKKHGFDVVSRETDGGHTWLKWRDYLNEFAPLLFADQ